MQCMVYKIIKKSNICQKADIFFCYPFLKEVRK